MKSISIKLIMFMFVINVTSFFMYLYIASPEKFQTLVVIASSQERIRGDVAGFITMR